MYKNQRYKETTGTVNVSVNCEVANNRKLLQLYHLKVKKNQYCQLKTVVFDHAV
jgi:hypothetical protein